MRMRAVLASFLLLMTLSVHSGQNCGERNPTVTELVKAAALAVQTRSKLEEWNAEVAIIARAGTDLSRYDLKYSHAALVVRDHHGGNWTVVHLLNQCGSNDSALFDQGLMNFFLDDLYAFDVLLLEPEPLVQQQILEALSTDLTKQVQGDQYNMVAHPYSTRYQNSNQWLLEFVVNANSGGHSREQAHELLEQSGFEADRFRIGRLKRLVGGLTQANMSFTHHPMSDRIRSRYSLVTVRSVVQYLEQLGLVRRSIELQMSKTLASMVAAEDLLEAHIDIVR